MQDTKDEVYDKVVKDLNQKATSQRASDLNRFFKTGKGGYGEGDIFLGIRVPDQRQVAKKYYKQAETTDIEKLLQGKFHEHRMTGLFIMTYQFNKTQVGEQKRLYDLYIKNIDRVNNWDLVDCSAHRIIGKYMFDNKKPRNLLYDLARQDSLWRQRIAILSTYYFIRKEDFKDTLAISEILLHHEHDLIHKAVGWMLREVGNRDHLAEEKFLRKHYKSMPRTMLRYAIEKFEEGERLQYLKGEI